MHDEFGCTDDISYRFIPWCIYGYKKSLKIPKEQSESVYWRRTDITMAKR